MCVLYVHWYHLKACTQVSFFNYFCSVHAKENKPYLVVHRLQKGEISIGGYVQCGVEWDNVIPSDAKMNIVQSIVVRVRGVNGAKHLEDRL